MSEQQQVDQDLRTRQMIVGVIILAAILAFISNANLFIRPWFVTAVGYALAIFVLLLLGRFVRAVERLADALEKPARREENRVK